MVSLMPDRCRTGRVLVDRQRDACCAVLDAVPPDAPTLCEGWTAVDLAAHLDALCRDPLSLPGIALRPLEGMARVRARRLQTRLGYPALVRRLHTGSPWIPAFGIDPWQGWGHHLGEWFVHTEDVRRANDLAPASIETDLDEALWRRVQAAARVLNRRRPTGLVLRCPDGREARVVDRPSVQVVVGVPSELLVWVYRGRAADVTRT